MFNYKSLFSKPYFFNNEILMKCSKSRKRAKQKETPSQEKLEELTEQEFSQVANDDEFMEEMKLRIETLEKKREIAKRKFSELSS